MGIIGDGPCNALVMHSVSHFEKHSVNIRYYDDGCEAILVFMCMQLLPG